MNWKCEAKKKQQQQKVKEKDKYGNYCEWKWNTREKSFSSNWNNVVISPEIG